jgi:acetyltransferase
MMQDGIAPKNPLDIGIPPPTAVAAKICLAAANDPGIDMVAWASPMPRRSDAWGDMSPFQLYLDATDKPLIAFGRMIHQVSEQHIVAQKGAGFPFLQGQEETLRALNALWFYAARRGQAPEMPGPAPASDLTPATLDATLERYGITLPKSREVTTAAEAAAAATEIGFPVVLKIRSADILHKTEAGGVALNLRDAGEVQAAADRLTASARKAYPNARIDGFLVQEMASGIEAIVGARTDALYGPMLLVGAGGILVELAKDAALRMLPVTGSDVTAMLDGLKLSKLLAGYRGRPAADRAALEKTVLALARFFLDHRAKIADIEINPLMVREHGAVAVDVRVLWRE